MASGFILKGNIVHTPKLGQIETHKDSYLICLNGESKGIYEDVPEMYKGLNVIDCTGKIIHPGFCDMHVHAPQYANRGVAMDCELMDWLERYTFPEESKFNDLYYADTLYSKFVSDLLETSTTRVVVYATIHNPATISLMEKLEHSGISGYVGKVVMDQNANPELLMDTKDVYKSTDDFIQYSFNHFTLIQPIITPRFIPSCTNDALEALGNLVVKYNLPVQSHLDENPGEIAFVKELHPEVDTYAQVYENFGLMGAKKPAVMAHCIHMKDSEVELLKRRGAYIAHCPQSNTDLSSGIAPIKKYMNMGMNIGIGSDISGGYNLDLEGNIKEAIQVSKLRTACLEKDVPPLNFADALYLATMGGGSFFGKVGCFNEGYDFDAVVCDDFKFANPEGMPLEQRMERMVYLFDSRNIVAKFVKGKKVF